MLGGWVLVRTRRDERGRAQWLLIKHRDQYAQDGFDVVEKATTSIVTGRTMDEIARGAPARKRGGKSAARTNSTGKSGSATRARA
jgi:bifunctional non-homologous end joining protein LigD